MGFGDYFAYTFVCRGQAEVMLETGIKPWDVAPLKILVEEAGGRFSDFTGAPTIYSGNAHDLERARARRGARPPGSGGTYP